MSEQYEKTIERFNIVLGKEVTTIIIEIAQSLIPQIEEGVEKARLTKTDMVGETGYTIYMNDIAYLFENLSEEDYSIESVVCILSSVLWSHDISVQTIYGLGKNRNFNLGLLFYKRGADEKEPSVEDCTFMWLQMWYNGTVKDEILEAMARMPQERNGLRAHWSSRNK